MKTICLNLHLRIYLIGKEVRKLKRVILIVGIIACMLFSNVALCFAAGDPAVSIVNPVNTSTSTSSNLLISVKITQPKTVKVSAYAMKKNTASGKVQLGEADMKAIKEGTLDTSNIVYDALSAENFTTKNNLTFYTKKIEGVAPGIYVIKVETIQKDAVVYSSRSYVLVKAKAEDANKLFDQSQSSTAVFLQGLIKSIFGN